MIQKILKNSQVYQDRNEKESPRQQCFFVHVWVSEQDKPYNYEFLLRSFINESTIEK